MAGVVLYLSGDIIRGCVCVCVHIFIKNSLSELSECNFF